MNYIKTQIPACKVWMDPVIYFIFSALSSLGIHLLLILFLEQISAFSHPSYRDRVDLEATAKSCVIAEKRNLIIVNKNLVKTFIVSSDCFFLFIRFVCLCSFQGGDLHSQLSGQFSVLPRCGTEQCGHVQSPRPSSGAL